MEEPTKDHGRIIICMDREYIHGLMGGNTMESTIWIRSMDMECTSGLMEGGMKGIGRMGSNMEKENIYYLMESLRLDCGKMEKELSG